MNKDVLFLQILILVLLILSWLISTDLLSIVTIILSLDNPQYATLDSSTILINLLSMIYTQKPTQSTPSSPKYFILTPTYVFLSNLNTDFIAHQSSPIIFKIIFNVPASLSLIVS